MKSWNNWFFTCFFCIGANPSKTSWDKIIYKNMSKRSRRNKNPRQRHQDALCSQVGDLIIARTNWTRADYPQKSSTSFLERIPDIHPGRKDVMKRVTQSQAIWRELATWRISHHGGIYQMVADLSRNIMTRRHVFKSWRPQGHWSQRYKATRRQKFSKAFSFLLDSIEAFLLTSIGALMVMTMC